MSALPKGLRRRGHRMMVVVPKYGDYKEAKNTGARARFNNFNSSQEVRDCVCTRVSIRTGMQIIGMTVTSHFRNRNTSRLTRSPSLYSHARKLAPGMLACNAYFCSSVPSSVVCYWHAEVDGVDYVFVEHSCFRVDGGNLYSGSRQDLLFRCSLLCKAALEAVRSVAELAVCLAPVPAGLGSDMKLALLEGLKVMGANYALFCISWAVIIPILLPCQGIMCLVVPCCAMLGVVALLNSISHLLDSDKARLPHGRVCPIAHQSSAAASNVPASQL
eukprot:scaffold107863_cov19-Tisochrysis_lutea.AAC.1